MPAGFRFALAHPRVGFKSIQEKRGETHIRLCSVIEMRTYYIREIGDRTKGMSIIEALNHYHSCEILQVKIEAGIYKFVRTIRRPS